MGSVTYLSRPPLIAHLRGRWREGLLARASGNRAIWIDAGITPVDSPHPTLDDAINPTDVFIAFICNDYESRIAGKEEFPLAVKLRQQSGEKQKPAIIPLTLTIDGRTFWNDTSKKIQRSKVLSMNHSFNLDRPI